MIRGPRALLPLSFVRVGARGALITLVPALLVAQAPDAGVVAGRVTVRSDTGILAPAQGATVSVIGSTLGTTTSADGRFVLEQVPSGAVTVRVRLARFAETRSSARSALPVGSRISSSNGSGSFHETD